MTTGSTQGPEGSASVAALPGYRLPTWPSAPTPSSSRSKRGAPLGARSMRATSTAAASRALYTAASFCAQRQA